MTTVILFFFHQETHTTSQPVRNLTAAFDGGAVIQMQILETEAEFFAAFAQGVRYFGIL